MTYVIDHKRGPHIRDYSDQTQDKVVICSGDYYWRENGNGYTNAQMAGVYTRDDAYKRAGHCGPEKGCCFYDVPADHVPTLQAEVERLREVVVEAANHLYDKQDMTRVREMAAAALAAQPATKKDQQ